MAAENMELSYAIRPKVLLKYLGRLFIVLSLLTLVPLLVAFYCTEYPMVWRLLIVMLGWAIVGIPLSRIEVDDRLQTNESMTLAAAIFLIASLVYAYPLMAPGLTFEDAIFESISSITTTGLSMAVPGEILSSSFLFLRSWMQWFGALAIVVFSLALLTQPGIVTTIAELQEDDLSGGMRAYFKRVSQVYFLLTVVGVIGTLFLDIGFFDAVLLTFSSLSTGGFSPYSDSLQSLNWLAQWWIAILCFIGAMPLMCFYRKLIGLKGIALDRLQIKSFLFITILITLVFIFGLRLVDKFDWIQAIHQAPLLVLSAQTTSGFSTIPINDIDAGSKLLLIFGMLIGGGVGSTSGGFKLLRLLIAVNIIRFILLKTCLSKHAVAQPSMAGRKIEYSEIAEGLSLILIYFTVVAFSWLIFVLMEYDPINALFEVTSAVGTVGLSVGITNPELPYLLKIVLCFDMLMGRLEILAWLVMLYPKTWIGRRKEAV